MQPAPNGADRHLQDLGHGLVLLSFHVLHNQNSAVFRGEATQRPLHPLLLLLLFQGVDANGHVVRTLKAGTYTIVVRDYSKFHNFELEREHGFEREVTDVSTVETKTMKVKLTRGSYEVYCDPHKESMVQRFTVR